MPRLAQYVVTMAADDFFREVTLRICGSLDVDAALQRAFEFIERHLPVDAMGLGYTDMDAATIRTVAKASRSGARSFWDDDIVLSGSSLDYVQNEAPDAPATLVVNRPDLQPPGLIAAFPELATSSAIFVRLDVPGDSVGAILATAEGPDRYTPEHARLLESVREPFAIAMVNARRHRELIQARDLLADDHRELNDDLKRGIGVEVVGADFGLREVMVQVRQVAASKSPVLLLGETGTGKEVIANAIHAASRRNREPLIAMQCGAVPETLLDSELFGHEKAAFTGATARKRGRFERAHRGTLFLDEIGELSPGAQVKLLRVLQEGRFERVGGTEPIGVDVRVVAATHRDLEHMVREGTFREDLWYRLNVLPIRIPPLRLRSEDVPSLVQYFVERKSREMGRQNVPRLASHDVERLKRYDWPGNVRELQNVVERALILSSGDRLSFPPLRPGSDANRTRSTRGGRVLTMDEAIAAHIRTVLETVDWQIAGKGGAAELLRMNPSTLRFRMQKLGISRT